MEYRKIIFILFSNYTLLSVNSSAVEEPKSCHWGAIFVNESYECINKCSESMGFIHPIQRKFICTENKDDIRGIPMFSEPNEEGLYDCVCVHPYLKDIICFPKKIYRKRTIDQCIQTCSNNLVLTFIQNDTREVYCSEVLNITLYGLEHLMLTGLKLSERTGKFYSKKLCKCGVDMDRQDEKKLMRMENLEKRGGRKYLKPLVKLPYLCHMEGFPSTAKHHCENKCVSAKAFLDSSNDLICYHDRIKAVVISPENEDCECGRILRGKNENERIISPCYPKQTYPEISNCEIYCQTEIIAYIFNSEPSRSVSYCDSRMEPPEGIESLEVQFGRWEKHLSPHTNKVRNEITCTCGVNSLSVLMEKSTNVNANCSTPINRGNKRNLDGASSSRVDLNPGITRQSKKNAIYFLAATNQGNILNLDGAGSYQADLNPRITEQSKENTIFSLTEKNPRNIRNLDRANSSQAVTNPEISMNWIRNVPAATDQIHKRNSREGSSTSEDVTKRRVSHSIISDDSLLPLLANPSKNLIGRVSSYVGVDRRTTINLDVNDSSYQTTTNRMPDQRNSSWNASRIEQKSNRNAGNVQPRTTQISENLIANTSFFAYHVTQNLNVSANSSKYIPNQNDTSQGKEKPASQSDHYSSFPVVFRMNEFVPAGEAYVSPQNSGTEFVGFHSHRSRDSTTVPWLTYPYNKIHVSNDDTRFGFSTKEFHELTTSVPQPSTNQPDIYFTSNTNELLSSSRALLSNDPFQNCEQKRKLDVEFEVVQPGDYDIPTTICQHENSRIGESSGGKNKFLLPDLNIPDKSRFIPDLNVPSQNSTDS